MNWSVILSLGKVLFVGRVNNGNLVIIDIEKGIKIIGCDSSCNKPWFTNLLNWELMIFEMLSQIEILSSL